MITLRNFRSLVAAAVSGAVVAVLLPAATAAAAETYVVPPGGVFELTGKGFGHGHGMSQYGAKGRGEAGQSWTTITNFYYPGTTVATIADKSRSPWPSPTRERKAFRPPAVQRQPLPV